MNEQPDRPERSLSARTAGGATGTVTAGSFEWSFDGSEDPGEAGTAPSPVDRLLGALAACLAASVGFQASKRDLDLAAVRVDVEGRPEHGPLDSIELRVALESAADDGTLARTVAVAERGCYVARTLRADLPVEVTWERL